MILAGITDIIEIVTASAVTVDVQASWADNTPTTFTPGRTNTAITTATTTTIVGSPIVDTQRSVRSLKIRNKHASSSNVITIRHFDGTTTVDVFKDDLLAGEVILYDGQGNFTVVDAMGNTKVTATQTITLTGDVTGSGAQSIATTVVAATSSTAGKVELATTTEVLTGTDTTLAVTPDALAALWEQGSNIASAGTISVGEGGYFHVTGTTTITDIDFATDKTGRKVILVFDGALTITHNATTLILPLSGGSLVTVAGDMLEFVSEGSDVVRCTRYERSGVTGTGNTVRGLSPNLTGVPTATTPAVDNNTVSIATTAYVIAQSADQAAVEAASSTIKFVSPGRQQFHPSAAKCWVHAGITGNIIASYNISSVTDTGTGVATINISTDFSTANWCCVVGGLGPSSILTDAKHISCTAMLAGSIELSAFDSAPNPNLEDPTAYFMAGFGDQA